MNLPKDKKTEEKSRERDPYLIVLVVMLIFLLYFYLKSKGIVP